MNLNRYVYGQALLLAGLIAVPLCLLTASCITTGGSNPGADDEIRYPKFQEYYHRGRERILVNNIQGAREDFETCIGLRKGVTRANKVDDWQVRTYGMHILDSYFPNRELGICFHLQGDDATAMKYLQVSTNQQASARAHFFINKINQAAAAAIVAPAPTIQTADVLYSNRPEITLTGTARASASVQRMAIGDQRPYIEVAGPTVTFSSTVPLKEGVNEVAIAAEDLKAQKTVRPVKVIADYQAPSIALISATPEGNMIRIKAVCTDQYGLSETSLADQVIEKPAATDTVEFEAVVERGTPQTFRAKDLAGNESVLDLLDLLPPPNPQSAFSFSPDRNHFQVHEPYFYFDGRIDCPEGIAQVLLNGKALIPRTDSRSSAIRFKAMQVLEMGDNDFHFVCIDREGKRTERTITVKYDQPIFVSKSLRLGSSVPPLFAHRKASEGYVWQKELINVINNRERNRFNLLTTSPEALNAIIQEKQIELSDLVNPDARIVWADLNEADWFFNGRIIQHSQGVELRFLLADTSHTAQPRFVDIYIDRDAGETEYYLMGLLSKIERYFPVIEGRVTEKTGSRVKINLGQNHGIFEGARFLVIAPGTKPGMANGDLRKANGQAVELLVDRVGEDWARAKVLGAGNKIIQANDYIYAR